MGCVCPKCKSNNIIPIMYGYPTHDAFKEAEKGNIKLGGCEVFIGGGQPDRFCKVCEHEWCVDDFLVEDILKIRFRYWSNWYVRDPELIEEDQWAFEVFPDGTVKYFAYPRVGRKVLDKETVHIETERVMDFYQNVIWLYRPWTEIEECRVCDGCSYELTITYKDNRKKKLTGDLGGGAQTALAAAGIKLFGGVSGDADKAVEAFINDALDYNPDVKCSNHENNNGEGNTCGEHGCGSHSCH